MTLRIRMILMNQFEHLLEELEYASEELGNTDLKSINADIIIAADRVKEFQKTAVKEFEKRHQEKLKKLKAIKRMN